jgi:hypothetical protein
MDCSHPHTHDNSVHTESYLIARNHEIRRRSSGILGLKVLSVVTIKCTNFWDLTLCSLVDRYQHLEPSASIFRTEKSVIQTSNLQEGKSSAYFLLVAWLAYRRFGHEDGSSTFREHVGKFVSVTFQNTLLFTDLYVSILKGYESFSSVTNQSGMCFSRCLISGEWVYSLTLKIYISWRCQ